MLMIKKVIGTRRLTDATKFLLVLAGSDACIVLVPEIV